MQGGSGHRGANAAWARKSHSCRRRLSAKRRESTTAPGLVLAAKLLYGRSTAECAGRPSWRDVVLPRPIRTLIVGCLWLLACIPKETPFTDEEEQAEESAAPDASGPAA